MELRTGVEKQVSIVALYSNKGPTTQKVILKH